MEINTDEPNKVSHLDSSNSEVEVAATLQADNAAITAASSSSAGGNIGSLQSCSYENNGSKTGPPNKKRKTRRFKNRKKMRNMPYSKLLRYREKSKLMSTYPQSEAPNNTTQFLMDYHHKMEGLDHTPSVSPESVHGQQLYLEEGNDFLVQDFRNNYTRMQEEHLTCLPKNKLIQIVIELEDRLNNLDSKLRSKNRIDNIAALLQEEADDDETELNLKTEVKELVLENKRLFRENELLRNENQGLRIENNGLAKENENLKRRKQRRSSSSSSSSSTSSSSSCSSSYSSVSSSSEEEAILCKVEGSDKECEVVLHLEKIS